MKIDVSGISIGPNSIYANGVTGVKLAYFLTYSLSGLARPLPAVELRSPRGRYGNGR